MCWRETICRWNKNCFGDPIKTTKMLVANGPNMLVSLSPISTKKPFPAVKKRAINKRDKKLLLRASLMVVRS